MAKNLRGDWKISLGILSKNDILKVLSIVIKKLVFEIFHFCLFSFSSNHKNVSPFHQYKTVQEYNSYLLITFLPAFKKDLKICFEDIQLRYGENKS